VERARSRAAFSRYQPIRKSQLWSRVGGDGLNLATLMPALHPFNPKRGNAELAMAAVLGVTLLEIYPASSLSTRQRRTVTHRQYRARSGFPNGVASARRAVRNGKVQRLQSAILNETYSN